MFLDIKEQSEPSSAHPPEFEMTIVHNHDLIRTKRMKLTETVLLSTRKLGQHVLNRKKRKSRNI